MKKRTVIITDPDVMRVICLRPCTVTREEALESILIQNGRKRARTFLNAVATTGCQANFARPA